MSYIGRFAPSPSGPLHYGSLLTALGSYLDARHFEGKWLLRIDDLDPPRKSPKAVSEIMNQLRSFRLFWDDEILFQSNRNKAYQEALSLLSEYTYYCSCNRKEVDSIYSEKCKKHGPDINKKLAVRIDIGDETISFVDTVFGHQKWSGKKDLGDFVIKRKDGLYAYQLAVVVDDIFQGITHVVRGSDLLESTPRQLNIFNKLGQPHPKYCHLPTIVDKDHLKLSKQRLAKKVRSKEAFESIKYALNDLGQKIPDTLDHDELLGQAIDNWDAARIPVILNKMGPVKYI
tara:strand:- start:609 stop:1469 length:861 start_codon:yes stop_codon:yes gene_type:complete